MGFKPMPGETVVLVQNGTYKQADVFEWNGRVFAKFGAGFIRLRRDGSTSKDGVRVEYFYTESDIYRDALGNLWFNPPDVAAA